MKHKYLGAVLVSLLVVSVIVSYGFLANNQAKKETLDVFVGVDAAYEDMEEAKQMIDETSAYTNLFILGCTGITDNFTKLEEMCQYIYDRGMYFIVYRERFAPRTEWLEEAKAKWGDRFLGFYAYDEAGGYQLDLRKLRLVIEADNYSDAAYQFNYNLTRTLNLYTQHYTKTTSYPLFTSDYALYWFDYKGGYDVILAQLGWNYSRQLNVALCRGAATMHDREWGAIITWTYDNPPYLGSGKKIYRDLVVAYKNGAKYIVVFDSNEEYTHGTLGKEHLEALRRFWHYVQNNPRSSFPISDRVAYVLPKDYAYGFRGPNDKIWGFWEADDLSAGICQNLGSLIEKYQYRLDVIYDDGLELDNTCNYSKLIFWNGTVV